MIKWFICWCRNHQWVVAYFTDGNVITEKAIMCRACGHIGCQEKLSSE